MADSMLSSNPGAGSAMEDVRKGMTVYDQNGEKVGEVADVFFGTGDENIEEGKGQGGGSVDRARPVAGGGDSYDASLETARGAQGDMPEVLRNRLERHGYVRINGGMLHSDRFALSEEIASVTGERVNLNVPAEKLVQA